MVSYFEDFDGQATPQEAPIKKPNVFDSFDEYKGKTVQEKQIEQPDWMNDTIMSARMVIDGMTLGWGDEAGAAVAAGLAKLSGVNDKPYTEVYREIKDSLQTEESKYRAENPALSMGLNIAGGIATGGVGMGKTAAHQVGKAAIAGGVAGAGTAKSGDTLKGAAVGTLFGGATGSLVKGGGWLWNASTQRRLAQNLGSGDDFIPINLAANSMDATEGTLANFYKSVVGTSFGGGTKLKGQEARIINPVARRLGNAEEAYNKAMKNSKTAVREVKEAMAQTKAAKIESIRELKDDIRTFAADERSLVKESFKGQKDQALLNAAKEFDEVAGSAERAFRGQAVLKSIPEGTADDVIDEILASPTPNMAMQKLDDLWARDGFSMLKDRQFEINPNSVGKEIKALLKNDFAAMDKTTFNRITSDVQSFLEERTKKGFIDGEDLSAIRSRLGMLANAKSDAGGAAAVEQSVFKAMQDTLNRRVKSQLSGDALKSFEAHTSGWKAHTTLRTAINAASKKAGKQGEFSPDDWVASIAKQSPREARQGKGVLREEADSLAVTLKERDKAIKDAADLVVSRAEKQQMKSLASIANKTKLEIQSLAKEAANLRTKSGETVRLRAARNADSIAQKKAKLDSLESAMKTFKKATVSENPTTFTRIAATYALGFGNLITGSALSRGLASEGFQRAVVGQTALQQSLAGVGKGLSQPISQVGGRVSGLVSDPNFISNRLVPRQEEQQ